MADEWNPEEGFSRMRDEAAILELTPEQHTRKLFKENSADAALQIVQMAKFAERDELRLKAAMYITDRVLGRITDTPMQEGEKDAFASLIDRVTTLAEAHANGEL